MSPQYEPQLSLTLSLTAMLGMSVWMLAGACAAQLFITEGLTFKIVVLALCYICVYTAIFYYCVRFYYRPDVRDPFRWIPRLPWILPILFARVVLLFKKSSRNKAGEFTKFPELPQELRYLIWEHACPDPRVVEVMRLDNSTEWCCPKESQGPPSPLLYTSKESRAVFLHRCTPFLPQLRTYGDDCRWPVLPRASHIPTRPNPITYFNSRIDTLFISSNVCKFGNLTAAGRSDPNLTMGLRVSPALRNLQYIALAIQEIDGAFNLHLHFPSAGPIQIVQNDFLDSFARRKIGQVVIHNAPPTVVSEHETSASEEVQGVFDTYPAVTIPWELKEVSRGGEYTTRDEELYGDE